MMAKLVWFCFAWTAIAAAGDEPTLQTAEARIAAEDLLWSAKTLHCEFSDGAVRYIEGPPGRVEEQKDAQGLRLVLDSLDLQKGSARLIGNLGASDVRLFQTNAGLSFEEITGSGNLNVTTVVTYQVGPDRRYPAAMARHHKTPVGAMFSQYIGSCRVTERHPY